MIYGLWDIESHNLVGDYPTQQEALDPVRNAVEMHGPEVARRLLLTTEDQDGEVSPVAHGEVLIDLALGGEHALRPAR